MEKSANGPKEETECLSFASVAKKHKKRITKTADRIKYCVSGDEYPKVTLQIGESIMNEAGFLVGDTVDILFYPENMLGIIIRLSDGETGLKLGKALKNTNRGRVQMTWRKPLPYHKGVIAIKVTEVRKNGIYFNFPKEVETFDIR